MTGEAMSPLRRRMIEDMTIRKLAPKTQRDYVQRIKSFAAFLGRSPDTASFEDGRRYQLHLTAAGAGVPTLNQSTATLRFFFGVTRGRATSSTTPNLSTSPASCRLSSVRRRWRASSMRRRG
jgi:integrase/recombinase XerD